MYFSQKLAQMSQAFSEIFNYLAEIHPAHTMDLPLTEQHIGKNIIIAHRDAQDIDEADVVIVGCGEFRNQYPNANYSHGPDAVREALYQSFYWHKSVKIADIGNIKEGKTTKDTHAALLAVLEELYDLGKKVVIIGGSHDLSIQQYLVYRNRKEILDMCVFDMLADIDAPGPVRYDNHLMETLTSTPNFIRNFSLIGFQSYYVNPHVIETFDRFGFDCMRVGSAREKIDHIEPSLRMSAVCSIDINAIRFADAPANRTGSPNGFYGDEMCKITRYAGMSDKMDTLGIYGYQPKFDTENITAKLIAQMIWYFIDGMYVLKSEADFDDSNGFLEYNVSFTEQNIFFKKSKKTNRWWMQLPEGQLVPCTYDDYLQASNNELPERWLREIDRLV